MALVASLGVNLNSNTTALREDLKKSVGSINSFKNEAKKTSTESKGAFSAIGGAFSSIKGAASSALGGLSSSLGGLLGPLQGVASGFSGAIPSIKGVGGALKAIPLLAIVGVIASLVSYLTQTKGGFEIVTKVTNGASAVFSVLLTRLQAIGSAVVKLFQGDFKGAWQDAKSAVEGFGDAIKENYDKSKGLADREIDLKKEEAAYLIKQAELNEKISEARQKANDVETYSAQQRAKYNSEAIALIKQRSALEIDRANKEYQLLVDKNALGNNTYDDDIKEAELKVKVLNLEKAANDELRSLLKKQTTLTNEVEKENDARVKSLQLVSDSLKFQSKNIESPTIKFPSKEEISKGANDAQIAINEKYRGIGDGIVDASQQMSQLVQASFSDMFSGLGESIGDLLSGDLSSLKGFFGGILSTIFDFAGKFGKVLIGIGTGALGLKQLFSNPLTAIAAGVALVALAKVGQNFIKKNNPANGDIKGFAAGGIIPTNNSMSLVGENGPELISNRNFGGSRVYKNSDSMKMLNSGGKMELSLKPFIINGSDLALIIDETKRKQSNTF
tara:strand:- start:2066 stop:3745 length:1680 start_codon:yes stop_codon:yes gene_type:complete